jgi:hypothetical protein
MISIDADRWPLVIYRFSGEVSLPQLEKYLQKQDELLARHQPTGSLGLAEDMKMWEPALLKRQAAWIKQNEPLLRKYSVGAALVMPSPVVRGMLKAILWMQPMPQPHTVCSNTGDALGWLGARFAEARIRIELPKTL